MNEAHTTRSLLTAKETAFELGVTIDAVYKKWKALGGVRGANGKSLMFDATIVRAAKEQRSRSDDTTLAAGTTRSERRLFDGKIAGIVFEELLLETTPVQIVIKHRISPEIVVRLACEFHAMRGAILLTGEHLSEIYKLPVVGKTPCETPGEMMALLRESIAAPDMCIKCQKRPRQWCRVCRASP